MNINSDLEDLLADVTSILGYRKAILVLVDWEKRLGYTRAVVGGTPAFRIREMGSDGLKSHPLEEKNPAYVAKEVELPFHTCLNDEYNERQWNLKDGVARHRYFQYLRDYLRGMRQARLDDLKEKGIFPPETSIEDFLEVQNPYVRLEEEDWSFQRMYPTFERWFGSTEERKAGIYKDEDRIYFEALGGEPNLGISFEEWIDGSEESLRKSYDQLSNSDINFSDVFPTFEAYIENGVRFSRIYGGMSDAQFLNTLTLGIHHNDNLMAIAQFNSPTGVTDYTQPLSEDKQREAQDKLEKYVPAILLEGVFDHLETLRYKLAHRDLEILTQSGNEVFTPLSVDSANEVFVSIPRDNKMCCVKKCKDITGAFTEAKVRRKAQRCGINVYPLIGTVDKFVISGVVPSVSLDDLMEQYPMEDLPDEIKIKIVDNYGIMIGRTQLLNPNLPTTPVEFRSKLHQAFIKCSRVSDLEDLDGLAEWVTADFNPEVRKQDTTPQNTNLPLEGLATTYSFEELIPSLLDMAHPDWDDHVKAFIEEVSPRIVEDPEKFVHFTKENTIYGDYESMSWRTFRMDDHIKMVDASTWKLSLDDRARLLGSYPKERLYIGMRRLFYYDGWVVQGTRKTKRERLIRDRNFYLDTVKACAEELNEPLLSQVVATFYGGVSQ